METQIKKAPLTGSWEIDPAHSNIQFSVSHLVISHVNGNFGKYIGGISNESPDLTNAKFHFAIDTSSINTGNETRDSHLQSDDFFNSAAYPNMEFESSEVNKLSDNTYEIKGNLKIRDVSKPSTFTARLGGTATDNYGNIKMGLKVSTTINRFDYGLKWNQLTEAGGLSVGKDVEVNANLQFARKF